MQEHSPRGIPFHELHPQQTPEQEHVQRAAEEAQTSGFNEQWAKPKEIDVAGEKLNIYDISPQDPKTETPVFIMDGWGSTPAVWQDNMHTLVGQGRRTLTVRSNRKINSQITPPEEVGIIPEAELRRITAFMAALDAQGVERSDVIAHSEGGVDALLAARMYPERFRNLVLVNPGGMIGPDSFLPLAARFAYDGIRSNISALRAGKFSKVKRMGDEMTKSVLQTPVRATQEVLSIARTQVIDLLREVKASGVRIVIIHGVNDKVFPMARMAKTIHGQKEEDEDIEKLLDGFYSVKGEHSQFMVDAAQYTRLAETALTALELKDKKS